MIIDSSYLRRNSAISDAYSTIKKLIKRTLISFDEHNLNLNACIYLYLHYSLNCMSTLVQKYVNPLLDHGFKKLFGQEANKRFLIAFLNELLPRNKQIEDLTYSNPENQGELHHKRIVIFDLLCHGKDGEVFVIEIQQVKQDYFKDRAVYYAARQISSQSEKGRKWEYGYKGVYVIAILGKFTLDGKSSKKYIQDIALRDCKTSKQFYDKIRFLFIELPNFTKSEKELVTALDKWLFTLKHMSQLSNIPETFTEEIFKDFFKTAEILTDMERTQEEIQQKIEWDHYAILQTAKREGLQIGLEKGLEKGIAKGIAKGIEKGVRKERLLVARNLKDQGVSLQTIQAATNLSIQEIKKL
jgi:predicted transposase/invertase (TIGR01784 family)